MKHWANRLPQPQGNSKGVSGDFPRTAAINQSLSMWCTRGTEEGQGGQSLFIWGMETFPKKKENMSHQTNDKQCLIIEGERNFWNRYVQCLTSRFFPSPDLHWLLPSSHRIQGTFPGNSRKCMIGTTRAGVPAFRAGKYRQWSTDWESEIKWRFLRQERPACLAHSELGLELAACPLVGIVPGMVKIAIARG